MIALTVGQIADIIGGTLVDGAEAGRDTVVTGGIVFDSRQAGPGDVFLALPGEHVDGHDFAAAAHRRGAVIALTRRPVGVPAIVVPRRRGLELIADDPEAVAGAAEPAPGADGDSLLGALAVLARHAALQLRGGGTQIVGVTGSSGKTSTKDLIAAVLERDGEVVAPPGSFNNELGHPWTVLTATESTKHLVMELSARGIGHIAYLAEIAPPSIGVVLNIGQAHLGEFGSQEAIAQAKGELVEALPAANEGGVAILNADDTRVRALDRRTSARVVTFGLAGNADVRAENVNLDEQARASFDLVVGEARQPVSLAVFGEHQVHNALAAAAVGVEFGLSLETIAAALGAAVARSAHRMDVRTLSDGTVLINDSYNANPDSMRAALRALAVMAHTRTGPRRTWAVLGEMAELGEAAVVEHDAIGRYLVRFNISQLVVVGTGRNENSLFRGAIMEGSWGSEAKLVATKEEAIELVLQDRQPGDLILVKASRSVGLDDVARAIMGSVDAQAGGAGDTLAAGSSTQSAQEAK